MTLAELITEARSIINQTDPDNSQITDAQLTIWANESYRNIVSGMESLPETTYSLTSALGDITLSTDILTLLRCYMLKQPDNEYGPLTIIGPDMLESIDGGWLSADVDVPRYFVRKSTFTGYLYPQPNTANIGQAIKLTCLAFPTSLSASSDTPDLPKNLQDIMPHYMAYRSCQQMGQDEKATNELILVRSQLKANRQISTKFSGSNNQVMWGVRDSSWD